jgi:hypothetical protein
MNKTLLTGMKWVPSSVHFDSSAHLRAVFAAERKRLDAEKKESERRCPVVLRMKAKGKS